MKLFFNYSLDCETPANTPYTGGTERRPFFHGPATWDAAEASVRGFVERMTDLDVRDSSIFTLGAGYTTGRGGSLSPIWFFNGYGGSENPDDDGPEAKAVADRTLFGGRAGTQLTLGARSLGRSASTRIWAKCVLGETPLIETFCKPRLSFRPATI